MELDNDTSTALTQQVLSTEGSNMDNSNVPTSTAQAEEIVSAEGSAMNNGNVPTSAQAEENLSAELPITRDIGISMESNVAVGPPTDIPMEGVQQASDTIINITIILLTPVKSQESADTITSPPLHSATPPPHPTTLSPLVQVPVEQEAAEQDAAPSSPLTESVPNSPPASVTASSAAPDPVDLLTVMQALKPGMPELSAVTLISEVPTSLSTESALSGEMTPATNTANDAPSSSSMVAMLAPAPTTYLRVPSHSHTARAGVHSPSPIRHSP